MFWKFQLLRVSQEVFLNFLTDQRCLQMMYISLNLAQLLIKIIPILEFIVLIIIIIIFLIY